MRTMYIKINYDEYSDLAPLTFDDLEKALEDIEQVSSVSDITDDIEEIFEFAGKAKFDGNEETFFMAVFRAIFRIRQLGRKIYSEAT